MLRLLALLSASALGADYMDCGSTALCGVVVLESGYGEGAYAAAAPGVHGLWPETDAYGSSACVAPSGSAATPTTVYPCYDDTDDPDADLGFEQHEWGKHGVCAGVADADDYFTQLCAIAAGPLAAMRAAREAGADLDAMADAVEGAGYSVFYVDDSSDSQLYLSACATSNGTWHLAAPSAFESVCGDALESVTCFQQISLDRIEDVYMREQRTSSKDEFTHECGNAQRPKSAPLASSGP